MSSRLRCWLTEAIRRDRYIGNGIRRDLIVFYLWIYNAYGLGGPSPLPPASYTFVHNEKPVEQCLGERLALRAALSLPTKTNTRIKVPGSSREVARDGREAHTMSGNFTYSSSM